MSRWYAVDAVGEAFERAKTILTPINMSFWLRLALVFMIAGGLSGLGQDNTMNLDSESVGLNVLAVGFAVLAVALFFGFIIMYLSAVSDFVVVKTLLSGKLNVLEYFKSQAGNGLKVFGLQLIGLGIILGSIFAVVVAVLAVVESGMSFLLLFAMAFCIVVAVLFGLAIAVIFWVLREFSVPLMLARGYGVLAGLSEAIKIIRSCSWQFIVFLAIYLVFGVVFGIAVAVFSFIIYFMIFLVLILAGFGAMIGVGDIIAGGVGGLDALVLGAGVVVIFLVEICVSYVTTVVFLPASVFLRYFTLVFLDKATPGLDLFSCEQKIKQDNGVVKVY